MNAGTNRTRAATQSTLANQSRHGILSYTEFIFRYPLSSAVHCFQSCIYHQTLFLAFYRVVMFSIGFIRVLNASLWVVLRFLPQGVLGGGGTRHDQIASVHRHMHGALERSLGFFFFHTLRVVDVGTNGGANSRIDQNVGLLRS
jgi:hypothetical protein